MPAPSSPLAPFYMWAGGKSRLIKRYEPYWPDAKEYTHYVEPFFGAGAIFAWLHAGSASPPSVVGDVNKELMGLLEAVKLDVESFLVSVDLLLDEYFAVTGGKEARKKWYYELREEYWSSPDPATLFVLMRLGFNGIWQTCADSNGLFGTPAGLLSHKLRTQVLVPEHLRAWSRSLQDTLLHAGSYAHIPVPAERSLVYLDPPYRGSFTTYGTVFGDSEQKDLVAWARAQAEAGHIVILANRSSEDDSFFEDLLPDASFHYFDVTYTAGRRKKGEDGSFSAKSAREFIAVLSLTDPVGV